MVEKIMNYLDYAFVAAWVALAVTATIEGFTDDGQYHNWLFVIAGVAVMRGIMTALEIAVDRRKTD